MLQHVKRRNFSGYVKKLIWEAMSLAEVEKEHTEQSEQRKAERKESVIEKTPAAAPITKMKPTASERIQQLKSQTKKQQTPPSSLPFMPSSPRKY
ncbi:hypothetical protein bcere0028_52950 [Bacillus cereus AH1271]|nr:hypothetical protein bcere0028_52950 [Bacillus cereus AH1271]